MPDLFKGALEGPTKDSASQNDDDEDDEDMRALTEGLFDV